MGPAAPATSNPDVPAGDVARSTTREGTLRRARTRLITGANGGQSLRTPAPLLPTHRGQVPYLPVTSLPTEAGETLALSIYAGDMAGLPEILSEGGYECFASFARLPPSVLFLILHSHSAGSKPPLARRRSNLILLEAPGARVSLSAEQLSTMHNELGTDFVETPNGKCNSAVKTSLFARKAAQVMKTDVNDDKTLFHGMHMAGGAANAPSEEIAALQTGGGVAVTGTYDGTTTTSERVEFIRELSDTSRGGDGPLMVLGGDGEPGDVLELINCGVDIMEGSFPFDCAAKGIALDFNRGIRIMLRNTCYAESKDAIVSECEFSVSRDYSRAYIHHMDAINEMLAPTLLAKINLWGYNRWFESIRESIETGNFDTLYKNFFERRAKLVADGTAVGIQPL